MSQNDNIRLRDLDGFLQSLNLADKDELESEDLEVFHLMEHGRLLYKRNKTKPFTLNPEAPIFVPALNPNAKPFIPMAAQHGVGEGLCEEPVTPSIKINIVSAEKGGCKDKSVETINKNELYSMTMTKITSTGQITRHESELLVPHPKLRKRKKNSRKKIKDVYILEILDVVKNKKNIVVTQNKLAFTKNERKRVDASTSPIHCDEVDPLALDAYPNTNFSNMPDDPLDCLEKGLQSDCDHFTDRDLNEIFYSASIRSENPDTTIMGAVDIEGRSCQTSPPMDMDPSHFPPTPSLSDHTMTNYDPPVDNQLDVMRLLFDDILNEV